MPYRGMRAFFDACLDGGAETCGLSLPARLDPGPGPAWTGRARHRVAPADDYMYGSSSGQGPIRLFFTAFMK